MEHGHGNTLPLESCRRADRGPTPPNRLLSRRTFRKLVSIFTSCCTTEVLVSTTSSFLKTSCLPPKLGWTKNCKNELTPKKTGHWLSSERPSQTTTRLLHDKLQIRLAVQGLGYTQTPAHRVRSDSRVASGRNFLPNSESCRGNAAQCSGSQIHRLEGMRTMPR